MGDVYLPLEVVDVKKRSTPTRLELHRLRFNRDGHTGSLLSFDELDERERDIISHEFFETLHVSGSMRDPYEAIVKVFSSWGIMCIHPEERRVACSHGYVCNCCGCIVIENKRTEETSVRSVL